MRFRCDLCGAATGRVLFPAVDRLFGGAGTFWLIRCDSCSLIHTRPVPDRIADYYPHDYYSYRPRPVLRRAPTWLRRLFDPACYHIPDLPRGARVLEIGCGAGLFLVEIAECGWEVTALDISAEAIRNVGNAAARTVVGGVEEARFPSGHFDAVFAWMLVEHLPDPLATMREVARVLRPGGTFAFSVPNAEAGIHSWRDRWYSLMVPTHLHHFTRRTIRHLLREAGLQPARFIQQRTFLPQLCTLALAADAPQWVDWINAHVRLARAVTHPLACLAAALGLSDALTVVARRPVA